MSSDDRGGTDSAYYERRARPAPADADDYTPVNLDGFYPRSHEVIPWEEYNPKRFFKT
jgi:hypothetical protein